MVREVSYETCGVMADREQEQEQERECVCVRVGSEQKYRRHDPFRKASPNMMNKGKWHTHTLSIYSRNNRMPI